MRVLIAGCGYVGGEVARELARQGHDVTGIRRSEGDAEALKAAGVHVWLGDLTHETFERPPGKFDWVVFSASPGRRGAEPDYRSLYVEGQCRLLQQFRGEPPSRWVYTGSTGVYGQVDGSWVKENSATQPATAKDQILLEAEEKLRAAAAEGIPSVLLRVAGIYGPDRLHLLRAFVENQVRIAGQGQRNLNMIHRDDVVSAIIAALRSGRTGETYNVVDNEPVTEIHFFTWLSETLGKWVPPFAPADVGAGPAPINRKVSNRRLTMELGVRLKYPTFRQGYTAEIKALTDAGLLDIKPEQR